MPDEEKIEEIKDQRSYCPLSGNNLVNSLKTDVLKDIITKEENDEEFSSGTSTIHSKNDMGCMMEVSGARSISKTRAIHDEIQQNTTSILEITFSVDLSDITAGSCCRILTCIKTERSQTSESSQFKSHQENQRSDFLYLPSSTYSLDSGSRPVFEKMSLIPKSSMNNLNDRNFDLSADVLMASKLIQNDDLNLIEVIVAKIIKIHQLLFAQSKDYCYQSSLMNGEIFLQISRSGDRENPSYGTITMRTVLPDRKGLNHCVNFFVPRIPRQRNNGDIMSQKLLKVCFKQLLAIDESNVSTKLIHPHDLHVLYRKFHESPRVHRRLLLESQRVSIDRRRGALQLNQYKLLDDIGQGSFGIVKLVYNEDDQTHYAMKILSKKKLMKKAGILGRMAPSRKTVTDPLAKVYREIALLKKLNHPNVVKLIEVLDNPDEDNLYLVFEFIQRGEVLQLPTENPLNEDTARNYFRDVVLGVEYLHYQRIVHRDIKPSNLLVDSGGNIKIADLGVSAELGVSDELLSGSAGTPAFAAPETTLQGARYSGALCDIWSMGVTLYSFVTGRVPWDGGGSIIGVQAAIRTESLKFPEKPKLSKNLRHLISRMLMKDTKRRITLREIKNHCWVTDNDKYPLPTQIHNCQPQVTVSDEEISRVVTKVPKLDTLILMKIMLRQHSFQNPFLSKRITKSLDDDRTSNNPTKNSIISNQIVAGVTWDSSGILARSETKQFHKTERNNSALMSYNWLSNKKPLPIEASFSSPVETTKSKVKSKNNKKCENTKTKIIMSKTQNST